MRFTAEYSNRIRQMIRKIRKEPAAPLLAPSEHPIDQILCCILTNYASESRAESAVSRLRGSVVDINELRVTSVAEMVEIIGTDYPSARSAAEEIAAVLLAIFNKLHSLDLSFFSKGSRRTADSFVNSLAPLSPHAKALMGLLGSKSGSFPLDQNMFHHLQRSGCLPPDCTVAQAQKHLGNIIKEREAPALYATFKRFASAHASRKPLRGKGVAESPGPRLTPPRPTIPGKSAPTPRPSSRAKHPRRADRSKRRVGASRK